MVVGAPEATATGRGAKVGQIRKRKSCSKSEGRGFKSLNQQHFFTLVVSDVELSTSFVAATLEDINVV